MGETQDIVDAVMYLEEATFVTGEILHVDGGASAGRWQATEHTPSLHLLDREITQAGEGSVSRAG
jgi:hypothetical protein